MRLLKLCAFSFSKSAFKSSNILGIPLHASEQQIKRAYYSKAKQFHPDTNGRFSSNLQFHLLKQAYEDMLRYVRQQKPAEEQPEISYPDRDDELYSFYESYKESQKEDGKKDEEDGRSTMDSFFEEFFNRTEKEFKQKEWNQYQQKQARKKQYRPEESEDEEIYENRKKKGKFCKEPPPFLQVSINLNLTPEQANKGALKTVNVVRRVICQTCHGKPPNEEVQCHKCNGMGLQQDKDGVSYCWTCNGKKVLSKPNCPPCKGKGIILQNSNFTLSIAPGMKNNEELIIPRKGHQNVKLNLTGNLIVRVKVVKGQWQKEEQQFRREGDDIYSSIKIGAIDAVLGFKLTYSTPWGRRETYVQPGIQDGEVITRKGQGYKKRSSKKDYGDHYISLTIVIPQQITPEQQEVFEQIRKLTTNPRPTSN